MITSRVLARENRDKAEPIAWTLASANSAPLNSAAKVPDGHPGDAAELRQRIDHLQREMNARVTEARQSGRAEGESQARSAAEETETMLERMGKSLRDLTEVRARLRQEASTDLVELSIAIARRVLHRECSVDPTALEGLLQAGLDRLDRQEIYSVQVHPSQAAAIRRAVQTLSNRPIEVIEKASAEPGALLFKTNRGMLDAGVETQLREIQRGLADRVSR
jgi:flagellar assembly protein FliH